MMNQTIIMGHLGSDPETRFTPSGQKVTNLRVAANQRRKGEEITIWWRVTIWGEQFDKILSYFKKGSAIIVTGEMLKPEVFTNRDGQPQVGLEIVAHNISFPPFGRKDDQSSQQQSYQPSGQSMQQGQGDQQQQQQQQQGQGQQQQQQSPAFTEDEIPF